MRSFPLEYLESRTLLSTAPVYYDTGTPHDPNTPESYQIGSRWTSTTGGSTGSTGQGMTLRWSIVPDGTLLGSGEGEPNAGSTLRANLNALYGSQSVWLPILQKVFDEWSSISGITYIYEPNDDGVDFSNSNNGIIGTRGDVRIGAHYVDGPSNTLAYNWSPDYGEMIIDSSEFGPGGYFLDTSHNSRHLRNVMAHEHGHGLGFNHVDPLDKTKLMEAQATDVFDGPQFDDMLAVQRNYGDFYEKGAGDNSAATAVNLGTISNVNAAVSNVSLSTTSDTDYYKFTLSSNVTTTINLAPFGPTYPQGPQGGTVTTFNAQQQMDLEFQVIASNGTTVLNTVNATGLGGSETLTLTNLAAGTYYVKVLPAPLASDNVQSYTLNVNVATGVTATTSITLDSSNNMVINDIAPGGKADALTVYSLSPSTFIISDLNAYLTSNIAGESGNGTHTITIPTSSITGGKVYVTTGAGNDAITIEGTALPVYLDAGAGTDSITVNTTSDGNVLTLSPSTGDDSFTAGYNSAAANIIIDGSSRFGPVTLNANVNVTLPANGNYFFYADTLAFDPNARLDLNDNDFVINSGYDFNTIQSLVFSGYSQTPDPTRRGIVSTTSQNSPGNPILALLTTQYASVSDWPLGSGNTVGPNALLGKYTYFGDTNIDGQVTADDYGALDANFGASGFPPEVAWIIGDTNFDGQITADDYGALDANFGEGVGNPLAASGFAPLATNSLIIAQPNLQPLPLDSNDNLLT